MEYFLKKVVPRTSYCSNGSDAALLDNVLKNNLQYFSIARRAAVVMHIFIDFKPVFTNYEGMTIPS